MGKIDKIRTNFKKIFPKGYETPVPKCQHIGLGFYDWERRNKKNSRIHKELKNLKKYIQKGLQRRAKKLFNMEEY